MRIFFAGSGLIHRLVLIYRFYVTICATLLQSQTNEKAKLSHTNNLILTKYNKNMAATILKNCFKSTPNPS